MEWIESMMGQPEKAGEYYAKLRHINNAPEDKDTYDVVEFIPEKGWQMAEGWEVIKWLNETKSPIERTFTLQEALGIWSAALDFQDATDNGRNGWDKKQYFKEKFNLDINP